MLQFKLQAERQLGYYFWRLFLPLSLIVMMAWLVFWIDPQNFAAQMGVSTASVFSLIGFLFSTARLLPRIAYLTRADVMIICSTVLVFGALVQAVMSSRWNQAGRRELALRIDRHARWIYPSVFGLLVLVVRFG
jgi:hypothetical protein